MAKFKNRHSPAKESLPKKTALLTKQSNPEENGELIFTLNSKTGELVKIGKVDEVSGQLQELSEEEYFSLYYAAEPYDLYGYQQAYYQGMADYETALCSAVPGYAYLPAEDAYYQGMADYAAAVSGATAYEYSPEMVAYYQRIAENQGLPKE